MSEKTCYSFVTERACPGCHTMLTEPGSIRYAFVAADSMHVNEDGVIQLHDDADLILVNPGPAFNCAKCGADLAYEAVEER